MKRIRIIPRDFSPSSTELNRNMKVISPRYIIDSSFAPIMSYKNHELIGSITEYGIQGTGLNRNIHLLI